LYRRNKDNGKENRHEPCSGIREAKKTYSYRIAVVDMWEKNFKKYSTRSLSKHPRSPSDTPPHSVKQRSNHVKKEPLKKVKEAAAPQPSEIVLFREVVRHYPKQAQRELVIEAIQKITARLQREITTVDLQPFWTAWAKVSGNEWSLVWLTEWAVSGVIPGRQQPAQTKGADRMNNINNMLNGWLAGKEQEVTYGD
jgi:hypothetical protein